MKPLSQHITESLQKLNPKSKVFDFSQLTNNIYLKPGEFNIQKETSNMLYEYGEEILSKKTIQLKNDKIQLGELMHLTNAKDAPAGSILISKHDGSSIYDIYVLMPNGWALEELNDKIRKTDTVAFKFTSANNKTKIESIDLDWLRVQKFYFRAIYAPTKSSIEFIAKYNNSSLQSYDELVQAYNKKIGFTKKYN